jgi:hypothetical protein
MPLMKPLAVGCLLATFSCTALGNSYQYELNTSFTDIHVDLKSPESASGDRVNIAGTYYFAPVQTKNHPLAEAAFLERVDNISLHYTNSNFKETFYNIDQTEHVNYNDKTDIYTVMARLWWLDQTIYTSVGLTDYHRSARYKLHRTDGSIQADIYHDHPHPYWQASLGYSPVAGLLVYTNFYEEDDIEDSANINVKYLHDFGETSLVTQVHYEHLYGSDIINIDMDYFLTRAFSIGGIYQHEEDYGDYDWAIKSRYFITPSISIDAQFTHFPDGHDLTAGVTARF